jgi:hypothetical protein
LGILPFRIAKGPEVRGLCVLLGWVFTAEAKEMTSTSSSVALLLNLAIDTASRSHRRCPEAEDPERPVNQRSSQAGAAERRGPRHAEDTAATLSLFRSAARERYAVDAEQKTRRLPHLHRRRAEAAVVGRSDARDRKRCVLVAGYQNATGGNQEVELEIDANTRCLVLPALLAPTRHGDELTLHRLDRPQAPVRHPIYPAFYPHRACLPLVPAFELCLFLV